MDTEQLRKEFEEKFGWLEGPDLTPTSLKSDYLLSWFLSKLEEVEKKHTTREFEQLKSINEEEWSDRLNALMENDTGFYGIAKFIKELLSQAQAEAREKWEQDMASELTKIQELIESYTPETLKRESFGLFCTHILGALEILKRKTYPISTKFPPQTN